jgi:TM2 domain-containing membrane protein YozV
MSSAPSPGLAALLSFIFPGLGQIYAGEVRRGLLWSIPMVLFIVAVVWVLSGGMVALLRLIATDQSRTALLVLNVAFFAYHLAAMFDAYSLAKRERLLMGATGPTGAPVALAMLVVLVLLFHGVPQAVGIWGSNALQSLLPGRTDVIPSFSIDPIPTATPGNATPTATPTQTGNGSPTPSGNGGSPTPTERPRDCPTLDPGWAMAQDGRVNLLLVGSDSRDDEGTGSNSLRTDTMILLSIETASCKAAMFGFPRNMVNAPLPSESAGAYPGGRFPELLNALWRRAAENPDAFPGSEGVSAVDCARSFECIRAWRALTGTVQQMAGVQVDGVIAVNLHGFVALVDAVGGVWLDIQTPVREDRYKTPDGQIISINIPRTWATTYCWRRMRW